MNELDDRARALFRAARLEAPDPGARERVRRAVCPPREPENRFRAVLPPVLAAAAVAASFAIVMHYRSTALPAVTAEPVAESVAAPAPSASVEAVPTATQSAAPARPIAKRAAPKPATLSDEIAALDTVRSEISAGHATQALKGLDAYDKNSARRLGAEATLLRVEALKLAGRDADADALALRFIDRNPGNPLVDRARSLVSMPNDAGETP